MRHVVHKNLLGLLVAGTIGCTGAVGSHSGDPGNVTSTGGSSGSDAGSGSGAITCVPGSPRRPSCGACRTGSTTPSCATCSASRRSAPAPTWTPSSLLYADFDGPMVPDALAHLQGRRRGDREGRHGQPDQKAKFIGCDPAASGCRRNTIKTFGRKAFRRPLTDAEVTRFLDVGDEGLDAGTPAEVAEATLLRVPRLAVVSHCSPRRTRRRFRRAGHPALELRGRGPAVLHAVGLDPGRRAEHRGRQQSAPDQGPDSGPGAADDRGARQDRAAGAVFHRNWVQMDNANSHWWNVDHDTTKFPLYIAGGQDLVRRGNRRASSRRSCSRTAAYKDLFLSPVAFINKDNAAIYG